MQKRETDPTSEAIRARAAEGLNEAKQRLDEALQHLQRRDLDAAIGALSGLDERIGYVLLVIAVLRDAEATQWQPSIEFERQEGAN